MGSILPKPNNTLVEDNTIKNPTNGSKEGLNSRQSVGSNNTNTENGSQLGGKKRKSKGGKRKTMKKSRSHKK